MNPELFENGIKMALHSPLADEQLVGDFLVAVALHDQLDDFFFSVRQWQLFSHKLPRS